MVTSNYLLHLMEDILVILIGHMKGTINNEKFSTQGGLGVTSEISNSYINK